MNTSPKLSVIAVWKSMRVASGAYAPELNKRCHRAVDSTGQTIEFLLTAKRDAAAAKRFFRKALSSPGNLGTSRSTVPGLPRPKRTEALAVPCDDGLGPDDDQDIPPVAPTWDSHAQSCRSAAVSFGRLTERCRTPS